MTGIALSSLIALGMWISDEGSDKSLWKLWIFVTRPFDLSVPLSLLHPRYGSCLGRLQRTNQRKLRGFAE